MSLGTDFQQLMIQAAQALPDNAIDLSMVNRVSQQLDVMQRGNMSNHINPATGQIQNLHAGSIVLNPHGLRADGDQTFAVFTGNQNYNAEAVSDGDIIFGSNRANEANIYWDKSAGQIQFRGGTSQQGYIDVDGTAVFGGGDVTLNDNGIILEEGGSSQDSEIKWHRAGDATTVYRGTIRTNPDGADNPYLEIFSGSTAALSSAAGFDTYAYANPTSGSNPFYVATLLLADDSSGAELYSLYTGYAYPGTGAKIFGVVKGNQNTEAFIVLNTAGTTAAITSVENGMLWHDTLTSALKIYLNGGWRVLSSW